MIYFNPKYQRFCPDTERLVPFSELPATPENFAALGWLEVVYPSLQEFEAYGPGSVVNGKWVLSSVTLDIENARSLKWNSVVLAYQKSEEETVTDSLGHVWPAGYSFARIVRDKRDFAAEQGETTIVLRDMGANNRTLTLQEATNLLTLIGKSARLRAEKRDVLLSQIRSAATVEELRNITWSGV